jgi:hypothetical protein
MTRVCLSLVLPAALAVALTAKPVFTSTWKSPDAKAGSYAGKKVVGLVVSEDIDLRMSTEEALARAVTERGADGIAAYRLIPKEEIHSPESARNWFQRAGAAGVVVMRLVDLRRESSPTTTVWTTSTYYGSFWNYYPYAWTSVVELGPVRTDTTYVVETLLFDVPEAKLLWAGTSESTNPKDAQALVRDIVTVAADQMKKDGLIKK